MFCYFFICIFHSVSLQQWWWGPTIMTILLLGKGDDDDQAQRHQPGDDDDDDDKHCWSGWIYQPGDDDDESEEDKQCWPGQKAPTWWKRWWWQWPWCLALHKVTAILTHLRFNQMSLTSNPATSDWHCCFWKQSISHWACIAYHLKDTAFSNTSMSHLSPFPDLCLAVWVSTRQKSL